MPITLSPVSLESTAHTLTTHSLNLFRLASQVSVIAWPDQEDTRLVLESRGKFFLDPGLKLSPGLSRGSSDALWFASC